MYHPDVTNEMVSRLERAYKIELRPYSVAETLEWRDRLSDVPNPADPPPDLKKRIKPRREVTEEEDAFIRNELLLSKADFRYWAERYCTISKEGSGIGNLYPLWESQELILADIAYLERATFVEERNDGQLIALLKARQLGGSTLAQALMAHRASTQNNLFGLMAADVPEQTAYLFDMFERVFASLPWYMRPRALEHTKSPGEIKFDGGTNVWTGSGKSIRGTEGERGQLGRGKTVPLGHLTELSTWEDTDQIRRALLPAIPRGLRTFWLFESSGRGRHNYWHRFWQNTKAGDTRFHATFIPWYAERSKYTDPAPPGWSPSSTTAKHAARCEAFGPRWLRRPVHLTRDQLYWYEQTRRAYEAEGSLGDFLENYCADDDEAFQFSGKSVFSSDVIQRITDQSRDLRGVFDVARHVEIQKGYPRGVRAGN